MSRVVVLIGGMLLATAAVLEVAARVEDDPLPWFDVPRPIRTRIAIAGAVVLGLGLVASLYG